MRSFTLLAAALGTAAVLSACGSTAPAGAPAPASSAPGVVKAEAPTDAPADAQLMTAEFTPAASLEGQIVYGTVSARGARPYQVALTDSRGYQFCGGTLIAPNWVMTAAHCTEGSSPSGIKVRAGVNRLSSAEGQTLGVSAIYEHPSYGGIDSGYDIALLKLSSNVTSSYASVAKLPDNAAESVLDVAGKYATVSGWGKTETGYSSDDLREVTLPITPNPTRCGGNLTPGNVICGEYSGGKDSCNGDSGGPLAASYGGSFYVLGIVSYGPEECRGYGVYTRVNAYLDWIARTSGVTAGGGTPSPTDPSPTPPAPGTTTYTAKLSSGTTAYAPSTTGFYYGGGTIRGSLSGPAGTDFDLYLQKQGTYGWSNVSSSLGTGSTENVSYVAGSGTYRWAVKSYSGSGTATLTETK